MIKLRYTLLLFLLVTGIQLQAQCSLTAYGDTTLCVGSTVQLNATPGFDTYTWSPATGLSHPYIPNPIATVTGSATYILTATMGTTNLINNSDFSLGNVGFTSGQTYSSIYSPCDYYVSPYYFGITAYAMPDHTPSGDNMYMSIDGCYLSPTVIWETTVAVTPFTNYDFSFWASRADAVQPDFEIHFIGDVTGDVTEATYAGIPYTGTWTWDEYGVPGWNSGANTSLTMRIVNLETDGYGNDFGLDDVSLMTDGCTLTDTVVITAGLITTVTGPTSICPGQNITLTATGGTSFLWNTGDTTAAIAVTPVGTTTYTVIGDGGAGCIDTVDITVGVLTPPLGNITGDDSLCLGKTGTLTASGGIHYLWNTSVISPGITVSPLTSTTYSVIVADNNGCTDTAYHQVNVSPLPLVPITSDTVACKGNVLPALTATGQNILWYLSASDTTGTTVAPVPNTDAAGTYVYYATQTVGGCESQKASSTVEVLDMPVFDLPQNLAICEGDTVMTGPASSSYWQYNWADGETASPRPLVQQGVYILNATNICGSHSDTCQLQVDLCACYFYLPNAFTPNADGINETYHPVYDCRIDTYDLFIFDRWGEVIFHSQNPLDEWNGKHHDQLVQQDVYVVLVQYTGLLGSELVTREHRGHVLVLR